jgi:hypothetical protein
VVATEVTLWLLLLLNAALVVALTRRNERLTKERDAYQADVQAICYALKAICGIEITVERHRIDISDDLKQLRKVNTVRDILEWK